MAIDRLQQLLADLRDFRLRRAASDEIVAMGADASGPLLEALEKEAQDGARWAIISCLGSLKCVTAVPLVASYVEDPNFGTVAREALISIAGRDLGPRASEWTRWAERYATDGKQAQSGPDIPADAGLSNATLVQRALDEGVLGCEQEVADRFVVSLPLSGGRVQTVTVLFGSTDHEGSPIVIVHSDCGEARPEHYETALRRNLRMPYGAVALRDSDSGPRFVMFNTILKHGLSAVELRKSILAVGELADRFRRQIEG
jgi:hypothetical protein